MLRIKPCMGMGQAAGVAAALSVVLGLVTWLVLLLARRLGGVQGDLR